MQNEKGFGLIEGLLIVVILLLVGFGGYYVLSENNDSSSEASTELAEGVDEVNNEVSENESYTVASFQSEMTFSVTESAEVTVSEFDIYDVSQVDPKPENVEVTLPSGIVFSARIIDGIGGDCTPRNDTVTVLGKIETADPAYAFVNSTVSTSPAEETFEITTNSQLAALNDGESISDSCTLQYSGIAEGFIFEITRDGVDVDFEEAVADEDLVELINSLSFSELEA